MKTEIFLIRHGEPHLTGLFLGKTDLPLSENGWSQLELAFAELTDVDVLISSPLRRCLDYARVASKDLGLPLEIKTDWQECDFGHWDGLTFEQIKQLSPGLIETYVVEPATVDPPGGEPFTEFSLRIQAAIEQALEVHQGKRIAILCHAGVIRTAVAWCLQMPYEEATHFHRLAIDYGSLTQINVMYDKGEHYPMLASLNRKFTEKERF